VCQILNNLLFFPADLGGGGGEEGEETLPDGGLSGSAGVPSTPGQSVSLRRKMARAQNRHRLVNKPQDFQVGSCFRDILMTHVLPLLIPLYNSS